MKKIVALMLSLLMVFSMSTALADDNLYFTYAVKVDNFSEDGLARFEALNGLYGYVNTHGDVVIPPSYATALAFENGIATVYDQKLSVYRIDIHGNMVTYTKEDVAKENEAYSNKINLENEAKAAVFEIRNQDLYCNGILVDAGDWRDLGNITKVENTASLWYIYTSTYVGGQHQRNIMLYDSAAGKLLLYKMDAIDRVMKDGLIAVHRCGVGFYVNEQGVMQIGPVGTEAFTFSEGVARVMVDEKYIYINTNGDIVSDVYDGATDMVGGFAIVKQDGQWFVINNQFQRVK